MSKKKEKISISDGVAPPEPRSLRSKKRQRPSDEICPTKEVQVTLHHQDTEGSNIAVVLTRLECLQVRLQAHGTITNQQDQAAMQYCLTKEDGSAEEKHANEMIKPSGGQEEPTVTNTSDDSGLQGFTVNSEIDISMRGEEEIMQQVKRSPCQTYSEQHQALTCEEGDGSRAAALVEHLGEKKDSQRETSQEEPSTICMGVAKESVAGFPAKKKRRMGMCGLKERGHFLQTRKRENGQNGAGRVENQICNNTADLVAQQEIISPPPLQSSPLSIPTSSVTENEAEIKLQSSYCGVDDRAKTEGLITVTTSDGTRDPVSTEAQSCDAEGVTVHNPEQIGELKSNSPVEEIVEGHLGDVQQQEPEWGTGEIPVKQRKDDAEVDCSPVITLPADLSQNKGAEKKKDGSEAAPLQLYSVTRTRDEREEGMMIDVGGGAEEGTSSTDRPGGFSCGFVEHCEAAVTPGDAERKDSRDPVEPAAGSRTVNTEHSQTRDTADLFGSGFLDYVSDSQLNSIALIEEEMMKSEEDPGLSPPHEDATDLICGLITELSCLNRTVMAAHRELEHLRRGSKTSRSSIR